MSNIADDTLAALEREGWIQDRPYSEAGMCLVGAVTRISLAESNIGISQFYRTFRNRYGCLPSVWNDTPGRTFDEVREALKLVSEDIEIEKEKGIVG